MLRKYSRNQPVVSIGMTVFNQAAFLTKTIESLLMQEYQDYELIVADNASDDGSAEICEHYAKQDNRIRLLKNKHNIGMLANFDLVLNACEGKFFLWASGHDLFHPKFLSLLVNEFNANDDSVALCYPRTVVIDENDNLLQLAPDRVDTRSMNVSERFRKVIWEFHWGNMVNGLFRTKVMRQIWKPFGVVGPDHLLIAHLSLIGTIAQVNEELFYRRRNRPAETPHEAKERYINLFSRNKYEAIIPYTMLAFEHINLVRNSTMKTSVKLLLYEEIKKCFQKRFKLQDEAVLFLQKCVDLLKSDFEQLDNKISTVKKITQLSRICTYFNPEYKPGFDRFNELLCHKTSNLNI